MPNSETHMASVWKLLAQPPIRAAVPWLADEQARAALLLGAISPDVRAFSGHTREETHFFDIPAGDVPGHEQMLARWPELREAAALPPAHAAFVAGYMTHLIMDQTWLEMIVMPGLFVEGVRWDTDHPKWRPYSLLMTYLEYRAADCLPGEAVELMAQAEPERWLPFVPDDTLARWRDHVVSIIRGGGPRLISQMFARSNGMSEDEMEAIVLSDERMAGEVFESIPRERIQAFNAETDRRSQAAITHYLADHTLRP